MAAKKQNKTKKITQPFLMQNVNTTISLQLTKKKNKNIFSPTKAYDMTEEVLQKFSMVRL